MPMLSVLAMRCMCSAHKLYLSHLDLLFMKAMYVTNTAAWNILEVELSKY